MHSKGAAIDYKNEKGKTPLMIAVAFQRHDLIAYFIENGADVKARDGPGHAQCPMPNAQHPTLNAQGPTANAQCPMPNAQCPTGASAWDIQALDGEGMSILHIACWFGHLEVSRKQVH